MLKYIIAPLLLIAGLVALIIGIVFFGVALSSISIALLILSAAALIYAVIRTSLPASNRHDRTGPSTRDALS